MNRKFQKYLITGITGSEASYFAVYWFDAKKGKRSKIYNIGGTKIISENNFLKKLIKHSKVKINSIVESELFRPKDIALQTLDVRKFKRQIGWKPKIKFNDTEKNLLQECKKIY